MVSWIRPDEIVKINRQPLTQDWWIVSDEKKSESKEAPTEKVIQNKVKFEIYGEEMIEKMVKASGNSGRVYLPPNWVGHQVKIIRID